MNPSFPAHAQSPDRNAAQRQPRILFYVQDSWGLGHIQRVSKLAGALMDHANCLLLCGHREAGWIVPDKCEYVRIPTLNTPLSKASGGVFWGRPSFNIPPQDAQNLRKALIEGTIAAFAPDVIIVENRPLGMSDELDGILEKTSAVKLFLTRGIMTGPERANESYLGSKQLQALRNVFDKVLVAADPAVWNFALEYGLEPAIAAKIEYLGYMSQPVSSLEIRQAREERGLEDKTKWIVCSAGGGALGESLVQQLMGITNTLSNVAIDVVQGPHSQLPWPALLTSTMEKRWGRLHRESRRLPLLHAAADLVVCPAGYNSLVEVMEGGAPLITISVQPDGHSEQALLSSRLSRFYSIEIMTSYDQLGPTIQRTLDLQRIKQPIRQTGLLNFDGLRNGRDIILSSVRHTAN